MRIGLGDCQQIIGRFIMELVSVFAWTSRAKQRGAMLEAKHSKWTALKFFSVVMTLSYSTRGLICSGIKNLEVADGDSDATAAAALRSTNDSVVDPALQDMTPGFMGWT